MEKRTCYNCGREYSVVNDDALRGYIPTSPWLDDVCKRCICYLRKYHTWTITDAGLRICADCFLCRHTMEMVVKHAAARRKRELVPPPECKVLKNGDI